MAIRINELIKDINRNGSNQGIGKPEPLKYRKAWSRRITQEHRLVYNFDENKKLIILSCKGHYENNQKKRVSRKIISNCINIVCLIVLYNNVY